MSDEDERQTKSHMSSFYELNNRRLSAIRLKLQEYTREKTKYNVEKLIQDIEFLQGELGHLTHTIAELNREINTQISTKLNLNAKIAILRSSSGIRYPNLQTALSYKERFEKELEKPMKSEVYRDLARRKIKSINEALSQLQIQDEYNQKLQQAEDKQIVAQNKREKFQESLNTKSRKQAEMRQLLNDSTTKLPEIESSIESLRLEREEILSTMSDKKQRRRSSTMQPKSVEPSVQFFPTLEQDTLEYEKRNATEQLEKIRTLINYFRGKMTEHNLSINDQPSSESSPLFQPITPYEEQTILSSYMNEHDPTNETTDAVAMKLPKNLTQVDTHSTTNEIIHSTNHPENSIEYKKELPSDILDKYAGTTTKKQHQTSSVKKNKKNKKSFGIKHSSQMVVLYNEVRASTGDSDALPYMPLYEYELSLAVKSLQLMEQSVQSYLDELSQRDIYHLPDPIDEQQQQQPNDIIDDDDNDDDIRDSAVDTFSEASSLIESIHISKDSASAIPQLTNIPEARSSSSSDDKKTIVSSASPPSSHHSHSKGEHSSPLTTVEELPAFLPPLTIQIAQMERQISDEGYRSVRNEKQQQQQATGNNSPLLIRSNNYDCTEKVDKWLSSTTQSITDENFNSNNHFQPTDIDNREENLVESTIPVSNN